MALDKSQTSVEASLLLSDPLSSWSAFLAWPLSSPPFLGLVVGATQPFLKHPSCSSLVSWFRF